jgi:hypothetical protein
MIGKKISDRRKDWIKAAMKKRELEEMYIYREDYTYNDAPVLSVQGIIGGQIVG